MMMDYSISTVYMTILTSNLLLILIAFFFHSEKAMLNLGYRLLAVFVFITFLRFILPFEFSFTQTILLPKYISLVVILFRHPFFFVNGYGVSIWVIFEIIWLAGIIVFFFRYIKEIRILKQYILLTGKRPLRLKEYSSILNEICLSHRKKNTFRILEIDHLDSPKLCGVLKPYILLPSNLTFSAKDMYYVLNHEAAHHFHHDILLKCMLKILSIIYWWNPACHFLYNKASLLLEMRIDDTVTTNHTEASNYLNCLLLLAESIQNKNSLNNTLVLSFAQCNTEELTKRFKMLIYRESPRNFTLNAFTFFIILLLYVLSYFYIFEAHYSPPEVEKTILLTEDTSYFIQNDDGTYDLYHSGIYFETVSSLDYYLDDIPIYTREEFDKLTSD